MKRRSYLATAFVGLTAGCQNFIGEQQPKTTKKKNNTYQVRDRNNSDKLDTLYINVINTGRRKIFYGELGPDQLGTIPETFEGEWFVLHAFSDTFQSYDLTLSNPDVEGHEYSTEFVIEPRGNQRSARWIRHA